MGIGGLLFNFFSLLLFMKVQFGAVTHMKIPFSGVLGKAPKGRG